MDRLIYVALSGARHTFARQATTAHNLANATTTGFRAQTSALRAVPVEGEGLPTRTFALETTTGTDFTPGAIQRTGRDLDVAIEGEGFIAVELPDGGEAYTRNGALHAGANGVLQLRNGMAVMGEGGPIAIPPDSAVTVARDGTVSVVPTGGQSAAVAVLGRMKLVNPPPAALERGADGLFRLRVGEDAPPAASVRLVGGALESSNVNVVEAMVEMIGLARRFELQMKMLQNAEANDRQASQILSAPR
jgi:flagellar basal-body rod protein FlgF